jgi:hypothetical protein
MIETPPTPYSRLNHVLATLVESVQAILVDNFVGAYLQGSFATGDFDVHSDVDWIMVTEADLTTTHVEALQAMHGHIYNLESTWAQHLEGSYFPRQVLWDLSQRSRKLWYLDNGARSLVESEHCNTAVVRWVLREQGLVLRGPPPATLVAPVSTGELRREILETLISWGEEILADPDGFNNRFYQSFIVLSYCRMLHDLQAGVISSKQAAADWAQANLDPSWRGLIERSWAGRPNPALSVRHPADGEDFAATLEFVRYVIRESKRYANLG